MKTVGRCLLWANARGGEGMVDTTIPNSTASPKSSCMAVSASHILRPKQETCQKKLDLFKNDVFTIKVNSLGGVESYNV